MRYDFFGNGITNESAVDTDADRDICCALSDEYLSTYLEQAGQKDATVPFSRRSPYANSCIYGNVCGNNEFRKIYFALHLWHKIGYRNAQAEVFSP